jgi:hypothetical protein
MQALEKDAHLLVQQSQEPGTVGADLSKWLDLNSMVDEAESHLKGNGHPLGVSLPHGWKSKAVKNTGKTIATGTAKSNDQDNHDQGNQGNQGNQGDQGDQGNQGNQGDQEDRQEHCYR